MRLFIYYICHILHIMEEQKQKQEKKDKEPTKKWIFEITTKLDDEFRKEIGQRSKGIRRGVIKEALEEAIRDWIDKGKKE